MESVESRHEAIVPLLQVRIFAYDFLRNAFLQEPSVPYLDRLWQEGMFAEFPFTEESDLIRNGVRKITGYFEKTEPIKTERLEELQRDFSRLFIGPQTLLAPPWESVYVGKERLLFQEQTLQVRQAYLQYGLLPEKFKQEADDHIGLELDFMYQLANLALQKLDSQHNQRNQPDLEEQEGGELTIYLKVLTDSLNFLENHLLKWVGDLTRDMKTGATTDFYKGMADILLGYIQLDQSALRELLLYAEQ
jgi:TorA maturation chaperone TorD